MKKKSISKLKKEADKWFSLYIRNRDEGVCFTCGHKGEIKQMQNGHYITRGNLALRYDELNCNTQCIACNIFKKGNMPAYALRLRSLHGPDILEELDRKSKLITKYSAYDYEQLIEKYKSLTEHP